MKNKIENILNDLEKQAWSVQEDFFSQELCRELKQTLISLRKQGNLKQAGIGRKEGFQVEKSIRNDEISWFDKNNLNQYQINFLDIAQQLQSAINEKLYLGLFELEIHFALYAPNAFYQRHLDQHKNQDTRVVTIIAYLNEHWGEQDGGELKLYIGEDETITVMPKAGTLVCFLSADFEHEVLLAKRERASLTGWFRKRP